MNIHVVLQNTLTYQNNALSCLVSTLIIQAVGSYLKRAFYKMAHILDVTSIAV